MIQKNTKIILPEFSYDIVMEILEKFGLKEKHQQISKKMFSLSQGDPEFKDLLEELPGRFLFTISRNYLNELVEKDNLPEMISEKLGVGIEKSKELLEELDGRILSQAKVIINDDKKNEPEKSESPEKSLFSQNIQDDDKKDVSTFPQKSDPYREKIE